jgi:PTH1 family peptidyl-tRNA hydrolase
MILVVGLGNPEQKYEKTRHNAGFRVVDELAKQFEVEFKEEKKFNALITRVHKGPDEAILIKPLTYMNKSGDAVKKVADYFDIYENDVWVIHDDIDIELGKVRIRKGGSSAGQKGIKSVIDALGTEEFVRFRIGIKPQDGVKIPSEDFVLGKFTPQEEKTFKDIMDSVVYTIKEAIEGKEIEETTK